jgi:hypothetical protein
MRFDGAVIKEHGVTFAIVVVKPTVLNSSATRENTRNSISAVFPGLPVILMAQNGRGRPSYHGRTDIVNFLANIDPIRIPWKTYTMN